MRKTPLGEVAGSKTGRDASSGQRRLLRLAGARANGSRRCRQASKRFVFCDDVEAKGDENRTVQRVFIVSIQRATPWGTRPASCSYAAGAADINKPCYTSCTSPEPLASRSGSVFALDSAAEQAQHPAYYSSRSGRIRSARWPPAMWVSRLGEARLPTCFIAGTRPGAPRRLMQGAFIENCILYSPVVPEVAFSLSEATGNLTHTTALLRIERPAGAWVAWNRHLWMLPCR